MATTLLPDISPDRATLPLAVGAPSATGKTYLTRHAPPEYELWLHDGDDHFPSEVLAVPGAPSHFWHDPVWTQKVETAWVANLRRLSQVLSPEDIALAAFSPEMIEALWDSYRFAIWTIDPLELRKHAEQRLAEQPERTQPTVEEVLNGNGFFKGMQATFGLPSWDPTYLESENPALLPNLPAPKQGATVFTGVIASDFVRARAAEGQTIAAAITEELAKKGLHPSGTVGYDD